MDGDFWHARGHEDAPGEQIVSNKAFWKAKLTKNVARDKEVNNALASEGWLVLRYWESDIKKDLDAVASDIMQYIPERLRATRPYPPRKRQ